MFENVILYKPEYITDADGNRLRFRVSRDGTFQRDENGELIPDPRGRYFRQWRDEIRTPDDIWQEIAEAALIPGVTSAPKLQPIETRLVMLQTGMRAPMGVKSQRTRSADHTIVCPAGGRGAENRTRGEIPGRFCRSNRG